jgi:hypothetical protein
LLNWRRDPGNELSMSHSRFAIERIKKETELL